MDLPSTIFALIGLIYGISLSEYWFLSVPLSLLTLTTIKTKYIKCCIYYLVFSLIGYALSENSVDQNTLIPKTTDRGAISEIQEFQHFTSFLIKENHVKLSVKGSLNFKADVGDTLNYTCKIRKDRFEKNPGSFDHQTYLRSQGIYGTLTCLPKNLSWSAQTPNQKDNYLKALQTLSSMIEKHHDNIDVQGFIKAILLGTKGDLSPEVKSTFASQGLSHLLAISGFHVSIIALILFFALRLIGIPPLITHALSLLILWQYLFVIGAPVSVQRAIIMYSLYVLSNMFKRKSNFYHIILTSSILILLFEPLHLKNPGFHLSFTATFFIVYLHGTFGNVLSGKAPQSIKGIFTSILVTTWATLGTLPIVINAFYFLNSYTLISNLIISPLVALILVNNLITLALSPFSFLSEIFANATHTLYSLLVYITHVLETLPGKHIYFKALSPLELVYFYTLLLLIPILIKTQTKFCKRFISINIIIIMMYQTFCVYNSILKEDFKITFLDVGQGDAIHIVSPSRENILIDAGNLFPDMGMRQLVPYFRSQAIQTIDHLFITHTDIDHYGGLFTLLDHVEVKKVYVNPHSLKSSKKLWLKLLKKMQDKNIPVVSLSAGDHFTDSNNLVLKVLTPFSNAALSPNNNSISLSIHYLHHDILLTGDLETEGEEQLLRQYNLQHYDIFKLGHHGSKTSNILGLLQKITPDLAIVSAGMHNKFNHPSTDVVNRLEKLQIPTLSTAKEGAISIIFNEQGYEIRGMEKLRQKL